MSCLKSLQIMQRKNYIRPYHAQFIVSVFDSENEHLSVYKFLWYETHLLKSLIAILDWSFLYWLKLMFHLSELGL